MHPLVLLKSGLMKIFCQASQPGDPTKGLGIPRESGLEGQRDLIIELPQDWGKQRLQSWRASCRGSVGRGSPQGQGHWKVPLGENALGVHH